LGTRLRYGCAESKTFWYGIKVKKIGMTGYVGDMIENCAVDEYCAFNLHFQTTYKAAKNMVVLQKLANLGSRKSEA
jgi:hypothetical protein